MYTARDTDELRGAFKRKLIAVTLSLVIVYGVLTTEIAQLVLLAEDPFASRASSCIIVA